MKTCLDTNAYSALKRGEARAVELIEMAREVYLPTIVLGELFAGFQIGNQERRNVTELDQFIKRPGISVAPVSRTTAEIYGILVKKLRLEGTPLPTNDVWIAATALEIGCRILTNDARFQRIPGVLAVGWD